MNKKRVNWHGLDVIDAGTNELVEDRAERMNVLQEYYEQDLILGYWIVADYNEGDFDIEEELDINWDGFIVV